MWFVNSFLLILAISASIRIGVDYGQERDDMI